MDPLSATPVPTATVPVPPPPGEDERGAAGHDPDPTGGYGPAGHDPDPTRGYGPASGALPGSPPVSRDSRNYAVAAHLSALIGFTGIPSLIGPLVVWLLRRDDDPFVAAHARDALNFNISALVYLAALVALTIVTFGLGVVVLLPVVLVGGPAWLVATIVGAVRASEGRPFRYPLTIDFIK